MQDGSCFSVDPVMPLKEQPCSLVTCSGKPSLLTRLLVLPGLFHMSGVCWLPAKPGCPQLEKTSKYKGKQSYMAECGHRAGEEWSHLCN